MSKIILYRLVILTTIFSVVSLNTGAKEVYNINNDTLKQNGLVIYIGNFSRKPAILVRDTTLGGNRFDYQWHKRTDQNSRNSNGNYQLSAFLVDSTLAAFATVFS